MRAKECSQVSSECDLDLLSSNPFRRGLEMLFTFHRRQVSVVEDQHDEGLRLSMSLPVDPPDFVDLVVDDKQSQNSWLPQTNDGAALKTGGKRMVGCQL